MQRQKLLARLNELLQPQMFNDYCPNGLQVQGREEICRVVTGVSLTQALIDHAINLQADAIVVHHGVFWNKDDLALTGIKYQRVAKLIKNDINLIAYHLPLDNHPVVGNNAGIARLLEVETGGQCGAQDLLWYGKLRNPLKLSELVNRYHNGTKHQPQYFGAEDKLVSSLAWCSGGAQGMFIDAINLGVDCYLSGEISEPVMGMSEESGVAYIAGGHYASECFGILSLTNLLNQWGLDSQFVELYNPV